MATTSKFILQRSEKTFCPVCHGPTTMLAPTDCDQSKPWFYVCWACKYVAEIGKGYCKWEHQ